MESAIEASSFDPVYQPRLDGLPNEILDCIVSHLRAIPEVKVEHRAWFSTQSVWLPGPHDPIPRDGLSPLDTLKGLVGVARVFRPIVQEHLFRRIVIRFSRKDFAQLNKMITEAPHLADVVQMLTYMVPREYLPDRERIEEFRSTIHEDTDGRLHGFLARASEQLSILESNEDTRTLTRAIVAFKKRLQHIRVIRLSDEREKQTVVNHLRRSHIDVESLVELDWTSGYTRALGTLCRAVTSLDNSVVTKWSLPQLDANSATVLRILAATSLTAKLECLLVVFDTATMQQIAPIFRSIFTTARNLQTIHIGFRQDWLSIPLEDIFHNLHLENLTVFSIVGWCLKAEEIIDFARRHKGGLVGMRLGVLLEEGPRWKDVLTVLREDLPRLRWLSLFKAGYTSDRVPLHLTMDEDYDSPSDDEDDDEDGDSENGSHLAWEEHHGRIEDHGGDDGDDREGEYDPELDSIASGNSQGDPHLPLKDDPESTYVCSCANNEHFLTADELGDDGQRVTIEQRKRWERWVVGCQLHGKHHSP